MYTPYRRIASCVAALVAAVVFAGPAGAQMSGVPAGVGNDPPEGPFVFDNGMAMVMSPTGGPIPITIDPNAPPWIKTFQIPPGTTIIPGQTFPVWEKLLIIPPPPTSGPPLPLTDWHEHIHGSNPPGLPFGWAGGTLAVHNPTDPDGLPPLVQVPGMVDPTDPTGIWFDISHFPPIPIPPNGLPVWIHKELVYNGAVVLTPSTAPLSIVVWEHPTTTPEPSSIVLAGLGGLALLARRRRLAQK